MMPPRLALWLLERSLLPAEREPVAGDLIEEFRNRAALNPGRARRWFWSQTLRSLSPNIQRRRRQAALERHTGRKGRSSMSGVLTDLRFALRLTRRSPLISIVGFLSLGVALALNVVLFTLANAVLFRSLPVRAPAELSLMLLQRPANLMHNFSHPDYQTLVGAARLPDAVLAYSAAEASAAGPDGAAKLDGEVVSGNFFASLGVPVHAGRGLSPEDNRAAAEPAVVVSHRLWRERFGHAAAPSGQTLTLNGQPFTVVGVAGTGFAGMQVGRVADFWVPLSHSPVLVGGNFLAAADTSWLTLLARIPRSQAPELVRQELDTIVRAAFEERGRAHEPLVLMPGARGDSALPVRLESRFLLLLGAAVLVLLVGCMNVANLQIARTESRRLELAVRAALGAGRSQLLRLMIIDALLLASASGVAAVGIAAVLKDRAASLIALFGQPVALMVPIDARVIAAALGLSAGAALVIGVLSAWPILRAQPGEALHEGRGAAGSRRRLQAALVVVQFAVSMALLTGAALLVRTLGNLRATDLGFDSNRLAVVEVSPEMARLAGPSALAYFEEAVRAVRLLPGVESAAVASVMPLDYGGSRTTVDVAGYTPAPDEKMELNVVRVTSGYFETVGVPLLQGRTFQEGDRADRPRRIIVNQTMARRFWPDGTAIGRQVRLGSEGPFNIEVVGVVADAHYRMVREDPRPSFYAPMAEWPSHTGVVHVRLRGEPSQHLDELRRAVGAVSAGVPVTRVSTLRQQIDRNIADERLASVIGLALASATILLAAAGLYSTVAFLVGRRTREIGVRMALGALTGDVRRLVLRDAAWLVAPGILGGLALAVWIGHALRGLLYGVGSIDLTSLVIAAGVLTFAALLSAWLPAIRATRIDPLVALRD